MSESIDTIIPVTWNPHAAALGNVNFGIALGVYGDAADEDDQKLGFFTEYDKLKEKHPLRTELLDQGKAWFDMGGGIFLTAGYTPPAPGGAPAKRSQSPEADAPAPLVAIEVPVQKTAVERIADNLRNIKVASSSTTFEEAIQAVANVTWFYFPFNSQKALTDDEVLSAAQWCESNNRFLMYGITDDAKTFDVTVTDDLGSKLKAKGLRRGAIACSKVDKNIAVKAAAYISRTDYTQVNSYTDLNYKKMGQTGDEYDAQQLKILRTKGYFYNVDIAAYSSKTNAMLQNTVSTSSYNETISEVIAIDSFLFNSQVSMLNMITSQKNLPITPDGQQLAIHSQNKMGRQYIDNGFLGQREVTHPVTKETVVTEGYITTTKPEDVYKLSDAQRQNHELYPINQYIYNAGSAWQVKITINGG